mgnify:CR=1 FL=1
MQQTILDQDISYIKSKFGDDSLFQNKKIAITGCGGFLGYYLTHYFANLCNIEKPIDSLYLLDNFMLGKPEWITEIQRKNPGKIILQRFDVTKDSFESIKGLDNIDYVLHLASIASPTFYRKYPIETLDANVWGLRQILDYYHDKPIKGLLFFSSSEIYGDPDPLKVPTHEEYRGNVTCTGPRACYDEAKRFGETMCYIFAEKYNMPIGVARPFNNYGPGMSLGDKRVPSDFANAVIKNQDIEILSDGSPKRTYCYVADAVVGYLKVLTYGKYDYFNIGIEKPEISVRELSDIYKRKGEKLCSYSGNITFKESMDKHYLTDNPNRRCPCIDKARKLLNYEPEIQVEQGVERYLKFLLERSVNI